MKSRATYLDGLWQADEENVIYYILGFFFLCLTGLPGLVFSGLTAYNPLTNVTFAALVAAAAYGFIQLVLSSRFLHKADKAHFLLSVGGITVTLAYFVSSFMLKEFLDSHRPQLLHLP